MACFDKIVVHDQGVPAVVHEVLGHRGAGIGSDVLQRSRIAGAGHDHGGVVHRAVFAQGFDDAGHGRFLLADRHVEALHARVLLVDDRVDADGRLAGLAVADDQLALAAADRRHGVDGLDAGLQRLADRLAGRRYAGAMNSTARRSLVTIGPLPSSGLPSGSTTRPMTASPTGTLSSRPVLLTSSPSWMLQVVAEDDHADRVLFQVEGQPDDAVGKLDHFAGHHARQAVDARNAVADFQDASDFADVDLGFVVLNFLLEN